jgi:hypothetical protein
MFTKRPIEKNILIFICSTLFLLLFFQNLILSSSYEIMGIRDIDDVAFHHILNKNFPDLVHFKIDRLIKINDYGYGNIFWLTYSILTLPFLLLAKLSPSLEFLAIASPREIALIFGFLSVFIFYKILGFFFKSEFSKLIVTLIFVSFPVFAWLTMKFGTGTFLMFLSLSTFYLTLKYQNNLNKKNIAKIATCAAACCATKLNGFFLMPVIILIIANRLRYQIHRENMALSWTFVWRFIIFWTLFTLPALFLSPFKPQYLTKFLETIGHFSSTTSSSSGLNLTTTEYFRLGILDNFVSLPIFIILGLVTITKIIFTFKNKEKFGSDFLVFTTTILVTLLYLTHNIKLEPKFIANYFSAVSFLILLPLCLFENQKKFQKPFLLMIFLLHIFLSGTNIKNQYFQHFQSLNSSKTQELLKTQKQMERIVGNKNSYNKPIYALADYRAIFAISNLREGIYSAGSFENSNTLLDFAPNGFDYIVLHQDSVGFMKQEEFDQMIENCNSEIANNRIKTRELEQNLINNNVFAGQKYEKVLEEGNIIMLKKLLIK